MIARSATLLPTAPAPAARETAAPVSPVVPPAPLAPAATGIRPRFTLDGSPELERHLAQTCEKIAAGLQGMLPARQLEAVLLGGGYGRGEGGVLRTNAGDRPYNDLEFYVCLRGNRHLNEKLHGLALHVLGEILTPQAGVDVEFKITSLREIATSPVSMFSYDLVSGHRWLIGEESMLDACAHHRDAEQIPLAEATRLLMNRGSGLLFARERLLRPNFSAGDADFTRRNIAKAQLALGDAVLVGHGQYHWSVHERHRRLDRLARAENSAWLREVCRHHALGVHFKLQPERSIAARETLHVTHAEVRDLGLETWLWLERRRLRVDFHGAADYASHPAPKWPETPALRNAVVNLKALGLRGLTATPFRHPRERILRALALLLWEPTALTSAEHRDRLQNLLATRATDFPGLVRAYTALWQHVN
jgi:hypothetical protein